MEYLRFHDEVNKWSREFHDLGMRTAEIRARRIVSLFVGDDAPYPVNLPEDIIESLRSGVGLQTISQASLSKSAPKLFKGSRRSSRKNASTHSVFSSSFQSKRKRDEILQRASSIIPETRLMVQINIPANEFGKC